VREIELRRRLYFGDRPPCDLDAARPCHRLRRPRRALHAGLSRGIQRRPRSDPSHRSGSTRSSLELRHPEVDKTIVCKRPALSDVGEFYRTCPQLRDDEVIVVLDQARAFWHLRQTPVIERHSPVPCSPEQSYVEPPSPQYPAARSAWWMSRYRGFLRSFAKVCDSLPPPVAISEIDSTPPGSWLLAAAACARRSHPLPNSGGSRPASCSITAECRFRRASSTTRVTLTHRGGCGSIHPCGRNSLIASRPGARPISPGLLHLFPLRLVTCQRSNDRPHRPRQLPAPVTALPKHEHAG